MKKFDSAKWITENKHGNSFDQELTTIFTEVFIQSSLPRGILRENLSLQLEAKISDVIKNKVNTLPPDVKGELKAFQQSLKDDGINFLEYLKSAAKAFKGVTEEELPALLASLEADGKLDEAVIEVNSIEDLKKLKTIGADTFTWNKETTSLPSGEFSVNGNPNNKQELIKGNSYTLVSRDLGELNQKESPRLDIAIKFLKMIGVKVSRKNNNIKIYGNPNLDLKGNFVMKHFRKDHRVFMMSCVAALTFGGTWKIHDRDSINTSFPEFFKIIKVLGAKKF